MRLVFLAASIFFATIVDADLILSPLHSRNNIGLRGEVLGDDCKDENSAIVPLDPVFAAPTADTEWDKALATGSKLHVTLPLKDRLASWYWKTDLHHSDPNVQTVQSPFDGDMKGLFRHWGYNEPSEEKASIDKDCDFEGYHKLKRAFEELGISTKSKGQGGPNVCLQIDHYDGPAVLRNDNGVLPPMLEQKYIDTTCGKEYRVSRDLQDYSARINLCRSPARHTSLASTRRLA